MEPIDNDRLHEIFERYYMTYQDSVFRRTHWLLSRYHIYIREQAEDLFQTIFFSAFRWMKNQWEETQAIPDEEAFRKALYTIEMAKYINCVKKGQRYAEHEVHMADFPAPGRDHPEAENPQDFPNPEHAPGDPEKDLIWMELVRKLDDCIKHLKPHESVAVSCKAQGDSDREIAAVIGRDERTVTHSVIPLARGKLSKCLEKNFYGYGRKRTRFSRS